MSGDEDLRRVRWRCRRGLLELDLILLRFVDECYPVLTEAEKSGFQELLSLPDAALGIEAGYFTGYFICTGCKEKFRVNPRRY